MYKYFYLLITLAMFSACGGGGGGGSSDNDIENISSNATIDISKNRVTTKLGGVDISTWMYQIQNIDDSSIDILASSSYDMLVLEAGFNFKDKEDTFNTPKMMSALSKKPNGDKRLLIAYIDIGQAEDYRDYWGDDWIAPTQISSGYPDFLITIDPDGWSGNYPLAYWDSRWKDIWLGKDGIIEKLVNYGFDGVYLDWIEAYDDENILKYAKSQNISTKDEMIDFIKEIKERGEELNPNFVVIAQNAPYLLDHNPTKYASVIDAIGEEDTWFYGEADVSWNDPKAGDLISEERQDKIAQYKKYLKLNIPVFTIDYCISKDNANRVYREANQNGFIPLVTRVSLSQMTETPPL